jgi:ATP-binding cassette, subfamily B, multidrug efflux pump
VRKARGTSNAAALHENAYRYTNHPFKWFWDLIRPSRGRFLAAQTINIVYTASSLIPAIVAGRLVDQVLTGGQLQLLPLYLGLMVGVPVSRALLSLLARYHFEYTSQKATMDLRENLYSHLQNLSADFYSRTSTGDVMAKMTGDVEMIRYFVAYTAFATIENVFLFTCGALYVFTVNWKLALIAVALTPLLLVITYRLGRAVRPVWREIRESFSRLNAVVQQNIAGNRVVRAFNRAEYEESKFELENDGFRQINIRQAMTALRFLPALEALANFLTVPVILVGGLLIIQGDLTLGGLVTFNGLLFVLSNPMRSAGMLMNDIQRYVASAGKINDLLLEKPRITSPVSPASPADQAAPAAAAAEHAAGSAAGHPARGRQAIRGKIEFRDVSFVYGEACCEENKPKQALANISFAAEPGQTVGIIGLTGSGKTTLVNLIVRLFDPTSGCILLDGIDLRRYNLQNLRRTIGMVMQDVFLFSDTIEGNIAYGVPDAPVELIRTSAQVAEASGFIDEMPDGYDTIVGERGVGLSGGQRQRIALARALALEPKILILDDTTSAVDLETEQQIQQALKKQRANRTVFLIAHRVSSIRNADQILVIDQGRIVERGTHDELVAKQGIYRDIYYTQAGLPEGGDGHGPQSL